MKIKLNDMCAMGENFSFGNYSDENKKFLQESYEERPNRIYDNIERHNMNYYKFPNGHLVHIYNASEVK